MSKFYYSRLSLDRWRWHRFSRSTGTAVAIGICMGVLAGCGATLNPALENGVAVGEQNGFAATAASVGSPASGSTHTESITGQTTGLGAAGAKLPTETEKLALANTPSASAYRIGPQDVLEISVFKVPELNRSVQVADVGTINLPLVNEVMAVGRTPQELERDLTAKLGAKYLQSPQVTVNVREYNSQRVTVEGAVRNPGVYPIKGKSTLLQAMAYAGGVDMNVATNDILVFRTRDGKRYGAKFSLEAIRSGNAEDPMLVAGDVVVVNTSDVKSGFNNFLKILPVAGLFALL